MSATSTTSTCKIYAGPAFTSTSPIEPSTRKPCAFWPICATNACQTRSKRRICNGNQYFDATDPKKEAYVSSDFFPILIKLLLVYFKSRFFQVKFSYIIQSHLRKLIWCKTDVVLFALMSRYTIEWIGRDGLAPETHEEYLQVRNRIVMASLY